MIRAEIDDIGLQAHLASLAPDGLTVFTLGGGRVRGALLHGTRMINSMRANHELGPLETMVLGRAYLAAGLLSSTIKGGDRLVLRVDGDGPAEGFSVEASAGGSVRGWLFRSPIALDSPIEDFDAFSVFGSGTLSMTRLSEGRPKPYVGTVALKTGKLAIDLASYYLESEQTRTAFKLGITFDREGRATGAGALYFQALPGADEVFLLRVEDALEGLPALGRYFAEGGKRESFLDRELGPLFPEVAGEAAVAFDCPCSRERFASFLSSLDAASLVELATVGPWPVETVCHNCGSAYRFPKEEIEAMLAGRKRK